MSNSKTIQVDLYTIRICNYLFLAAISVQIIILSEKNVKVEPGDFISNSILFCGSTSTGKSRLLFGEMVELHAWLNATCRLV